MALVACTEPGDRRTFNNGSGEVTVEVREVEPQWAVYQEVAACAGLTGDPGSVRWYQVAPIKFPDGRVWYGVYTTKPREIFWADSLSLRHEILHDLLWTNQRETGHPVPPFGKCAIYDGA